MTKETSVASSVMVMREGGGRWSRGISAGMSTDGGVGRVGLRGGFKILTNGARFVSSF